MIRNFANKVAGDIWETNSSKTLPKEFWIRAKALLTIMHATTELNDLKIKGQRVTIKLPWCITFKFKNGEFMDVKIEDYH